MATREDTDTVTLTVVETVLNASNAAVYVMDREYIRGKEKWTFNVQLLIFHLFQFFVLERV